MEYRVLICDDDEDILTALEIYLKQEKYQIVKASNGQEALDHIRQGDIHLVFLDVMMPVMDGIVAAVKIREISNVPILFLSAKGEDTDRVLGLGMGGDDYITKPFNPVELLARAKAHLRRFSQLGGMQSGTGQGQGQGVGQGISGQGLYTDQEQDFPGQGLPQGLYQTGGLVLDDQKKVVLVEGEEVALTATEYHILKLLMSNMERVFSANQIYEQVWNEPPFGVGKIISVHIRHIREKIEINPKDPRYLKIIYGLGYKVVKLK